MRYLLTLFVLLLSVGASAQQAPNHSQLPSHPRLILKEGDVALLREKIASDDALRTIHLTIKERANQMIVAEVNQRKKVGRRLLGVSRSVLERVLYCSYMYLVEGGEQYARRAEKEMLAASNFSDWNPSHYLDVAEMTTALAIGYDWLYHWLSPESRRVIGDAIIEKGLRSSNPKMWWYRRDNNWNQVCNAGLVMGALAMYEQIPEEADAHIQRAIKSNPIAQKCYAPDGVYPEGYGYWEYGTTYEVLLIESLRTSLGKSFDLEKAPGFVASAMFMNFMKAPSTEVFNFADCGSPSKMILPLLYWFAIESGDMSIVWQDRKLIVEEDWVRGIDRLAPVSMLFAARCDLARVEPIKEKFWYGRGAQPLFIYRSGFENSADTYLAAKGGSPSSNHGHMDSGSFIYEWGGVRWAIDLGSQNYHSLESKGIGIWKKGQESERWQVYRLNNYSHNTLTINEELHQYEGMATMTKVIDNKRCRGAEFDLSSLFIDMTEVLRTISIDDEDKVTCIDRLHNQDSECKVRWNMCTYAKAEIIDDHTISLKQSGKEVILNVVAPMSAKAYIMSNNADTDYDVRNKGVRVGFALTMKPSSKCSIKVEIIPQK